MARILVIEDDKSYCKLLGIMLTGAGYEAVLFESAVKAMASIKEENAFDLVITDILMPEMDGIDVIRALRQRGARQPSSPSPAGPPACTVTCSRPRSTLALRGRC